MTAPEPTLLDRLRIYAEVERVIDGLRIALRALAFYADGNARREEDGGDSARQAIKQIDELLGERRTPEESGAS